MVEHSPKIFASEERVTTTFANRTPDGCDDTVFTGRTRTLIDMLTPYHLHGWNPWWTYRHHTTFTSGSPNWLVDTILSSLVQPLRDMVTP